MKPCWECNEEKKVRLRGLGDDISHVTKLVGIKPCPGCTERSKKLNQHVHFGVSNFWSVLYTAAVRRFQ